MCFVPIKTMDQQALLTLHRVRQSFVVQRTAVVNRIRGLLAEFWVVIPQRVESLRRELPAHCETLPGLAARAIRDLQQHLRVLDIRIGE